MGLVKALLSDAADKLLRSTGPRWSHQKIQTGFLDVGSSRDNGMGRSGGNHKGNHVNITWEMWSSWRANPQKIAVFFSFMQKSEISSGFPSCKHMLPMNCYWVTLLTRFGAPLLWWDFILLIRGLRICLLSQKFRMSKSRLRCKPLLASFRIMHNF